MCGNSETSLQGVVKNYNFNVCSCCDFTFCPQITEEYITQLYCEGFHGPEDGAPSRGWGRLGFLDPVFELLPKGQSLDILDFGTGQSRVPEKLRENGHKVIAVDIVPPLRPHPDRLTGNLLGLQLNGCSYDLVFSFQVFEHLPHPRPLLDELLRLAKPGGLILIHTDMETPERETENFQNWWYVMPPDHCCFYRHKTFEVYLKDMPHEIFWKDEKSIIIKKAKKKVP